MKWEKKPLGEIINLKRGYDLPSQKRKQGFVPIISSSGITDFHSEPAKTGEGVVTGRYGTLGLLFYINGDYWPLNTTLYVQDFRGNVPRFIYYLLKTLNLEKFNGASAVPGLDRNVLHKVDVNYISHIPTQRKIASILSAYDDLIENNLKRIKLLEEKAQLHYKELMQEMSYSKTKREEYIKDCLAFYIGGGWGEEDYKEGFTEPAYVIRGTDIPDAKKGEVKGVPFRYHKESNLASRSMQVGDVVFEVSGGSKGQPVGRSILITEKMLQQFGKPVMCASFCKLLRPNENVTPEFFYLYLLASHENGVIAQYEKHSASNIVNYGFEEFISEQKITIPKESELKAFTEKVKPIFTLISTLGEQNSKLREARDILLRRLMNGQIEV
ncbi:MAG: restriction endonuclease subunit S [Saprospiraceae bacterium]|nr:restriction endonuclease subunit S [Saprospiraceae bacterium]